MQNLISCEINDYDKKKPSCSPPPFMCFVPRAQMEDVPLNVDSANERTSCRCSG